MALLPLFSVANAQVIDAALQLNGATYFFIGNVYFRLHGSQVDKNYPLALPGGWKDLPKSFHSGIDAAFYHPKKKRSYFFKGNQYVRLNGTRVEPGYPKPITQWKGLPDDYRQGIEAAVYRGGYTYFFRSGSYVRIRNTTVDSDYPKLLPGGWKLRKINYSGLTAMFNDRARNKNYMFFKDTYWQLNDIKLDGDFRNMANWKGLIGEDELRVYVQVNQVPQSIWENKPIIASCHYYIKTRGGSTNNKDFRIPIFLEANWIYDEYQDGLENKNNTGGGSGEPNPRKFIDIPLLHGRSSYQDVQGKLVSTLAPSLPGSYKYRCRIGSTQIKQSNKKDDVHETTVSVKGEWPIKKEEIPTPLIMYPYQPAMDIDDTTEVIEMTGLIAPDKVALWEFAAQRTVVFDERWNFQLLKKSGSQYIPVSTYSGSFTKSQILDRDWSFKSAIPKAQVAMLSAGQYKLESWLSQADTPEGEISGPKTSFEFRINRKFKLSPNITALDESGVRPIQSGMVLLNVLGKPDLTVLNKVHAVGKDHKPNDIIQFTDNDAVNWDNGRCALPIQFFINNRGSTDVQETFKTRIFISNNNRSVRQVGGIGAGNNKTIESKIWLTPGVVTEFSIEVDIDNSVQESSERNNQAHFKGMVSGDCSDRVQ